MMKQNGHQFSSVQFGNPALQEAHPEKLDKRYIKNFTIIELSQIKYNNRIVTDKADNKYHRRCQKTVSCPKLTQSSLLPIQMHGLSEFRKTNRFSG